MDNPVVFVVVCFATGGVLGGLLICVAQIVLGRRKPSWSMLLPDWEPLAGMLPSVLFACAFVWGRAEWTPYNLVLVMACSGLSTYILAVLLSRSTKLRAWGHTIEFNAYLVESLHALEAIVENDAIPEEIRIRQLAWTRERAATLEALMKRHEEESKARETQ